MEHSDIEEELVGLLAVAKRQQAALDEQFKVVQTAAASLDEQRRKITTLLMEVRNAPNEAVEALGEALAPAIRDAVGKSIIEQRKSLGGAVNAATKRLDEARDKTSTVALVWGVVGAVVGGIAVGVVTWALH